MTERSDPPAGDADWFIRWWHQNWRDHPLEMAYQGLTGQGQALVRHILYCLSRGYVHPDDLADWLTGYHQGGNAHLVDELPVSREGLRLAQQHHERY